MKLTLFTPLISYPGDKYQVHATGDMKFEITIQCIAVGLS